MGAEPRARGDAIAHKRKPRASPLFQTPSPRSLVGSRQPVKSSHTTIQHIFKSRKVPYVVFEVTRYTEFVTGYWTRARRTRESEGPSVLLHTDRLRAYVSHSS